MRLTAIAILALCATGCGLAPQLAALEAQPTNEASSQVGVTKDDAVRIAKNFLIARNYLGDSGELTGDPVLMNASELPQGIGSADLAPGDLVFVVTFSGSKVFVAQKDGAVVAASGGKGLSGGITS